MRAGGWPGCCSMTRRRSCWPDCWTGCPRGHGGGAADRGRSRAVAPARTHPAGRGRAETGPLGLLPKSAWPGARPRAVVPAAGRRPPCRAGPGAAEDPGRGGRPGRDQDTERAAGRRGRDGGGAGRRRRCRRGPARAGADPGGRLAAAIRQALAADAYHVLHLSAHGSPDAVELEDEDGSPVTVEAADLMRALKHAGRPVPLIVLSSCSGGATGSARDGSGPDRPGRRPRGRDARPGHRHVRDRPGPPLYRELAAHPDAGVGQALARARVDAAVAAARSRRTRRSRFPGVRRGHAAGERRRRPLVDPAPRTVPLSVMTTPPAGRACGSCRWAR